MSRTIYRDSSQRIYLFIALVVFAAMFAFLSGWTASLHSYLPALVFFVLAIYFAFLAWIVIAG